MSKKKRSFGRVFLTVVILCGIMLWNDYETVLAKPKDKGTIIDVNYTGKPTAIVIGNGVNLRNCAGVKDSMVIGIMYYGESVTVFDSIGVYVDGYHWIYVRRNLDGYRGWVATDYLNRYH